MKRTTVLTLFLVLSILNCTTQGEPLISHLYGYLKNESDSTGVNNIVLKIRDINPYDVNLSRVREDTTRTEDSQDGFFEMDSVCYGTTEQQGTGYVAIFADSLLNPGWPSQYWWPSIAGDVDTIIIYIAK